ncbi:MULTISPECIES: hypothetical protein [Shewanella]|uniref:Uncharacterized protein n=1 Tax=Shewanella polaris TaxID=2588449 RepID=A0A4Y5YAM5_9GAMM|nr:hypothetical protein [Shewanella polaris]QDE29832.1 hypothetical protein FH971_01890 [Shewanella polaris]
MKVILIVILVAIALYLYRRTQAVAKQEQDKTDSNAAAHSSSNEIAKPSMVADDTAVADPEHAVIDKVAEDDVVAENEVVAEHTAESVEAPTTAIISESDRPQTEMVTEPETVVKDAISEVEVNTANVEASVAGVSTVKEPSYQGQALNLRRVEGDWASESFIQQVDAANNASDLESQHSNLASVINHCYKMRKQADYCQYGAALQLTYLGLYSALHQQCVSQKSTDEIKSPVFMQLSTLLNDVGQFDDAIKVCQQALEYQLTDGTVTGFEGRIKRIEKAKAKVS